jgi:hypothetical protein
MALKVQSWIKYFLMRVGGFVPTRAITAFALSIKYLELGRWMRTKGYRPSQRFAQREALFDLVGKAIGDRTVLYLEFGVFKGDSTRHWSKVLHNPSSNLHGFDSFEGLPEDWNSDFPKGHFSTGGMIPQIDDERVKFFKGWFEETLPTYEFPLHEVLVINLDADLYSSTIYVLRTLEDKIVPGTYIYFDEFSHMDHEFRAFDEFMNETGMKFSLVGLADSMQHVVFRREE